MRRGCDAAPALRRYAITSLTVFELLFDSVPHEPIGTPMACITVSPTRVTVSLLAEMTGPHRVVRVEC